MQIYLVSGTISNIGIYANALRSYLILVYFNPKVTKIGTILYPLWITIAQTKSGFLHKLRINIVNALIS